MAVVELRIPADASAVLLARTAAASLCARLDFSLDRLEDARLAVDEACALLTRDAVEGASLWCGFEPRDDGAIDVDLAVRTAHGRVPRAGSFAWTVLTTLAAGVSATADDDGTVHLHLELRRDDRTGDVDGAA